MFLHISKKLRTCFESFAFHADKKTCKHFSKCIDIILCGHVHVILLNIKLLQICKAVSRYRNLILPPPPPTALRLSKLTLFDFSPNCFTQRCETVALTGNHSTLECTEYTGMRQVDNLCNDWPRRILHAYQTILLIVISINWFILLRSLTAKRVEDVPSRKKPPL